jgi:hypothetical protein
VDNPVGQFAIEWVESGENTVFVRAEGFADGMLLVEDIPPGEHVGEIEIALEPGASVAGHILDVDGRPVPGASIFLNALPGRDEMPAAALAHSDASGHFELGCLPTGGARVFAAATGFAPASVDLVPDTVRDVRIVLAKAAILEGTVRLDGQPLPNQTVRLLSMSGGFTPPSQVTSLTGNYRFVDLTPGEATVEASLWESGDESLRKRRMRRVVPFEATKVAVMDFDFAAADATVQGTVTLEGAPVTDFLVELRVTTAYGEEDIHVDNLPDGTFVGVEVPAGHATLTVRAFDAGGREHASHVALDIADGQQLIENIDLTSTGP